jgi:hypothetical protein
MTYGHLLDDRPEISVVPLEPALIFRDEPLEMMKKHPVENGPFRISRTIDSCHSKDKDSGNTPEEVLEALSPGNSRN